MIVVLVLVNSWLHTYRWFYPRARKKQLKRRPANTTTIMKSQRKPEWVTKEIIRLKAFMPNEGCRKIADTFNRIHTEKWQMTVGKSFVYYTISKHANEIRVLRRKIVRKRPRHYPKNFIWSMDLTQAKDRLNNVHNLFGIVDSGTRACLFLNNVKTKASITLLRCLLDTIEQFGKPVAIRTDNEAVFTSRLFRFCLWVLQIKHQRTQVCSPWQNGRIERFFGTLKQKLALYDLDEIGLTQDLATYRFWYNHVRTHQYLNGKTPAEVSDAKKPRGKPMEFSAWGGALTGIYFSPN